MIRVHVWYEFSSSSSLLLRLRRASFTFPWLRRLRALPSGPTALTTGRRGRTGIFVFIWCEWGQSEEKGKIRYYIVLERSQGPTLLDCNYADTCFTVALGSVLAGCYTQVPHRSTLYQHPRPSQDTPFDRLYCCYPPPFDLTTLSAVGESC